MSQSIYDASGTASETKKVFVHTQSAKGKADWVNQERVFLRVPIVGEFFALDSSSPWFRVDLVVHCPFKAQYAAEVYATQVNHSEVLKAL